jgi:hypothetical protein
MSEDVLVIARPGYRNANRHRRMCEYLRVTIVVRVARLAFAVLAIFAVVWIPLRNVGAAGFSITNYFSYFTIESNVAAIVVLVIGALVDPQSQRWNVIRGAVTLYIVITGIVYAVLLANVDVMLTDRWINNVLHRLIPIVLFADWIIAPPRKAIRETEALSWLAFPALYGMYSLVRGPVVDWYPYPFLDPRDQGYVSLVLTLVILAIAMALLALAVAAIGRLAGRWWDRGAAAATTG